MRNCTDTGSEIGGSFALASSAPHRCSWSQDQSRSSTCGGYAYRKMNQTTCSCTNACIRAVDAVEGVIDSLVKLCNVAQEEVEGDASTALGLVVRIPHLHARHLSIKQSTNVAQAGRHTFSETPMMLEYDVTVPMNPIHVTDANVCPLSAQHEPR